MISPHYHTHHPPPPHTHTHGHTFISLLLLAHHTGGEKRLATSCWLEDCLGDIRNVGHIRLKCAMHQTLASKHDYLDLVRGILAYLYASVRQVG